MTEEHPTQERRRQSDATAQALTGSSPDVNAIFQGLVEKFIALPSRMGAFFSWWLANFWIICALGVPAMLAAAPLLDKMYQGDEAVRAHELEMFKLQTDVEIKKLDRTLLGENAAKTLDAIMVKLDQQAEQSQRIQNDVQKLSADLKAVQRAQSITDRRVGTIQQNQQRARPVVP